MSTQLEIFCATVAHEPHDEFLFYGDFIGGLHERFCAATGLDPAANYRAELGMWNPVWVGAFPAKPTDPAAFDLYFIGEDRPAGAFINALGVLEVPGSQWHFTHYVSPLRNAQSLRDLEAFPYTVREEPDAAQLKAQVDAAHAQGLVAIAYCGHMYENAWQVRGYEPFLMDMMIQPEWCEYILDRYFENNLKSAVAAARAGVDMLYTADDVANQRALMFDIGLWRRFIKSRWAQVYAAARAIKPDIEIWYHTDGGAQEIIPELIEIGVTILNPIQPECFDLIDFKKRFGQKVVMDGTIGTQTTMPFGTPEDVRAAVRERKETLGRDGALILSPTHVLEPEVPIANVLAFIEACRETTCHS